LKSCRFRRYGSEKAVTEGDRNQHIKLDKAPKSTNKFLRKFSKHTIWLLNGFVTFVGFFQLRGMPRSARQRHASAAYVYSLSHGEKAPVADAQ
jgi:polyferredoxin